MKTVYIATRNSGKINEFKTFFNKYNIKVKSLLDFEENFEIEETGSTFSENALIKARYLSHKTNEVVLADDSGLEVDILNNEPGIYSARYAGSHGDSLANNLKLLAKLKDVPLENRTARFVCAIAIVHPDGKEKVVRGECNGLINLEMSGSRDFGYDPLFYIPALNKTFGELTNDEKELISHRGDALRKLDVIINE